MSKAAWMMMTFGTIFFWVSVVVGLGAYIGSCVQPDTRCLVSTTEAETCVCRTVTKKLVTQRICVCEVPR